MGYIEKTDNCGTNHNMNFYLKTILFAASAVLLTSHAGCKTHAAANRTKAAVSLDTFHLYDQARHRDVPVAVYQTDGKRNRHQKMVLVSHGYGENSGDAYLYYTFLTEFLAREGYFVVSIQHELPTDSLIPMTGIPQVVRRPFWERGADNILFVIKQIKQKYPDRGFEEITLIGHSNGGDMSALFPQKYPGIVDKIITFDNRRMALPRSSRPRVYSLRSSDQTADAGVLPTAEEQALYGMKIVALADMPHNSMCNQATAAQRQEINRHVLAFLQEKKH